MAMVTEEAARTICFRLGVIRGDFEALAVIADTPAREQYWTDASARVTGVAMAFIGARSEADLESAAFALQDVACDVRRSTPNLALDELWRQHFDPAYREAFR